MSANRRHDYNQISYYNGNAVRKLNTVPQIQHEVEELRPVAPRKATKAKPRRNPAIGFFTFTMLTGALAMTLFTAINYVQAQLDVKALSKSIASAEVQLSELKLSNEEALNKINASIDLEDTFNTAVNELGMVFPNKNQVINYETAVCEYIRQYDCIPEANAEDLLEKLFH